MKRVGAFGIGTDNGSSPHQPEDWNPERSTEGLGQQEGVGQVIRGPMEPAVRSGPLGGEAVTTTGGIGSSPEQKMSRRVYRSGVCCERHFDGVVSSCREVYTSAIRPSSRAPTRAVGRWYLSTRQGGLIEGTCIQRISEFGAGSTRTGSCRRDRQRVREPAAQGVRIRSTAWASTPLSHYFGGPL